MSLGKRLDDLNVLLEKLDISQSMVDNATEKYQNISNYLQDKGIKADIYPQGSFAIGTVIRPHRDSKKKNYDLDFVCKIKTPKEECSPNIVKQMVGNALKENKAYSERLEEEWDRCWTLVYADIGDIGFSMDIVPAVEEAEQKKDLLRSEAMNSALLDTAIALTEKNDQDYSWLTNNPKGYQDWFNDINNRFREWQLFEYNRNNRSFYNSIEEIPEGIGRTSLQKVVQVLKRHRDVYFIKRRLEDDKPISAIITTLVANVVDTASFSMDPFRLLEYVTEELMIYSHQRSLSEVDFSSRFPQKRLIQKVEGKWLLPNPANPEDNLIDSWNEDSQKIRYFFEWIEVLKNDFVDTFNEGDEKFLRGLENGLGSNFVRNSIQTDRYSTKTPAFSINPTKPWRNTNEVN